MEPEDDRLAVNFADSSVPILQWIDVGGYAEEPTAVRGWNVPYLDANGHIHDHMIPGARGDIACAVQRARELLNALPAWARRRKEPSNGSQPARRGLSNRSGRAAG